ncbi:MAG: S-adenosyl-l-methionine hydroxide adenosyltransferase family protein [Candidatus Bathyarchaeia archaeon]
MPIITLLSDFGLKDPYVSEMKATILSICPSATLIDITHEVAKYDVVEGAFILASASPFFPKKTVHLAVVDPGVGSKRRPIIVKSKRHLYVGPDNGLLILAAKNDGLISVYHITNREYMREEISSTFHGRDIFAPVSAHLANGVKPEEIGIEVEDYEFPEFVKPVIKGNLVELQAIHIDSFGNVITNLHRDQVEGLKLDFNTRLRLRIKDKTIKIKFLRTYSHARKKELLALVGSHDFLEIAMNQGSASDRLKLKKGSRINLFIE